MEWDLFLRNIKRPLSIIVIGSIINDKYEEKACIKIWQKEIRKKLNTKLNTNLNIIN